MVDDFNNQKIKQEDFVCITNFYEIDGKQVKKLFSERGNIESVYKNEDTLYYKYSKYLAWNEGNYKLYKIDLKSKKKEELGKIPYGIYDFIYADGEDVYLTVYDYHDANFRNKIIKYNTVSGDVKEIFKLNSESRLINAQVCNYGEEK